MIRSFERVPAANRSSFGGQVAKGLRTRLAVTTALASAALVGYSGRAAYAGSCVFNAGTYECSDPANDGVDVTQTLAPGGPVTVTADGTFGIDTTTTGGYALEITGTGGLSFDDLGNASPITGDSYGIYANNYVAGNLSITSTGHVRGNDYAGIYAFNDTDTGNLTINAADTSGGEYGISAYNRGAGALAITSTGQADGTSYSGIDAINDYDGTSLTINSNNAMGGLYGIRAANFGDGALNITSSGQTRGTAYDGINAANSPFGTDLTIQSNNDHGGYYGIYAINAGSGALSITSTGTATGDTVDGIYAVNSPYGTDLTIVANNVSGGNDGVFAVNYGAGALNITTTGSVNATNNDGIAAYNATYVDGSYNYFLLGYSTDLIIRAEGPVIAGDNGVKAVNYGSGELSITTTSTVQAGDEGIEAHNSAYGTSLTVETQDAVTADDTGIRATNFGSGPTTITVSGAVTGGTGDGIETITGAGGNTIIHLNAGANVSSGTGVAITNDDGDSTTTVNTGASVTGAVQLGDGSDNLIVDGGDISGATQLDGGDDIGTADGFIDTLTFRNVDTTVTGGNLLNWENVEIGTGSTLQFSDDALSTLNLDVTDGGILSQTNGAADAFALTGDLSVDTGGTLTFEFFTDTLFDTFDVSGLAAFGAGSVIDFLFDSGFAPPGSGTELTFFTSGGIGGFGNLSFNFLGLDPLFDADVLFDDQLGTLSLSFQSVAGDVPEPPTFAVLGSAMAGFLALQGWRRRRIRKATSDPKQATAA